MSAEPIAGWKPIYPQGWREGRAFVSRKRAAAAFVWVRACTGVVLLLLASCSRLPPVSAVDLPPFRREVRVSGFIGFMTRRRARDDRTLHERSGRRYFRARLRVLPRFSSRALPCLGRELRTASLSIPRRCARPRTASICEGFISEELGRVGA